MRVIYIFIKVLSNVHIRYQYQVIRYTSGLETGDCTVLVEVEVEVEATLEEIRVHLHIQSIDARYPVQQ